VTGRLFYLNATTGEKRWRRPTRTITLRAAAGAGARAGARTGVFPLVGAQGGGGDADGR
jgi:outer membrane protein assembly factor BamB